MAICFYSIFHPLLPEKSGKFLVSYNDCEEIRSLYDGCRMFSYERLNNIRRRFDGGSMFGELLIANYDMDERKKNPPKQISFFDDNEFMEEMQ